MLLWRHFPTAANVAFPAASYMLGRGRCGHWLGQGRVLARHCLALGGRLSLEVC